MLQALAAQRTQTNTQPHVADLSNPICPRKDEDSLLGMHIVPCPHEIADDEQTEESL